MRAAISGSVLGMNSAGMSIDGILDMAHKLEQVCETGRDELEN